jgi:hypothetical protein
MGLYNFQERFVAPILAGAKRQTIRANRKHPDAPGDTLHLYTGLRHKGARLLARVHCTWTAQIQIDRDGLIAIDGVDLTRAEYRVLAERDGFASYAEMMEFWKGRLPFEGQILGWGTLVNGPLDPRD